MKLQNIMKKIFCGIAMAVTLVTASVSAFALEDGAYTISRQTSYVNPDTGNTVDGGTNIALGDSMCASIVEDKLLVEKSEGKTYITIGLGLMSNITNVRIQVQDENGEYHDAEITKTGSCERDGDTYNHYRFEVSSEEQKISPIIYVTPMGRDVQFFVIPDLSSVQSGSGNFNSEMVKKPETTEKKVTEATTQSVTVSVNTETTENKKQSKENKKQSKENTEKTPTSEPSSENNNHTARNIVIVVSAIVIVGGIVTFIVIKRRKR